MSPTPTKNEDTQSLQNLLNDREIIISKLTRFIHFLKSTGEETLLELESRLDHIPNILRDFDIIQSQIESLDKEELKADSRESFENSYYKSVATARGVIAQLHNNIAQRSSTAYAQVLQNRSEVQSSFGRVCLPPIDLPKFDGDYKKWVFFFQRFSALVDQNKQLSNIEKFYYLQGRLQGEALTVIQDIELTNENYGIALQLLVDRFENKKVIIDKHIDDLFDIPEINKESSIQLRKLVDTVKQHIRALKSLGEPTDSWDRLLIKIIKSKLHHITRDKWQEVLHSQTQKSIPTFAEFLNFLVNRCEYLESLENNHTLQTTKQSHYSKQSTQINQNKHTISDNHKYHKFTNVAMSSTQCMYCNGLDHYIYSCKKFLNISVAERIKEINNLKLCINCLRAKHDSDSCARGSCKVCQQKHNTLVHSDNSAQYNFHETNITNTHLTVKDHPNNDSLSENDSPLTYISYPVSNEHRNNVLLSTASVFLKDSSGNLIKARALLDSGSQSNLITKSLAQKLNLPFNKINLPITGINQATTHISQQLNVVLISRLNHSYQQNLSFLVMDKIAGNIPNFTIESNKLNIPANINLADPNFEKSERIDLLLGAGIFWDLLCNEQYKLGGNQPILQKTKLGWVISGPINTFNSKQNSKTANTVLCNLSTFGTLADQIEAFWNQEECQQVKNFTIEEAMCEEHFAKTIQRGAYGRFKATLPIRLNVGDLGNSRETALKRFYKLENKLLKNSDMRSEYLEFMREYEQLGHMSKIQEREGDSNDKIYYLPHHGVLKGDSITTKLRVVFDGSAKTDTGISLNDKLMIGPTIQQDLFSIIVRFRLHNYAMVADITKMYRQIEISEEQRNLQRIFWREGPDLPLSCYTLNTVTYGTGTASFIAIRCLHQLAIENMDKYPTAASAIKTDFYVDDLITGADTVENAKKLRHDINKILENGCFPLRKWKTNEPTIFNDISVTDIGLPSHYLLTDSESKTLGLIWNSGLDTLTFKINTSEIKPLTKRTILSAIAQIFDPLGLVGPVITKAKIIMQMLWQQKISWDELVPLAIAKEFNQLHMESRILADIKVPRRIAVSNVAVLEIHGFSDASIAAYGACLYMRSIDESGNCAVILICAKSRVAPLKVITLPRLELSAAVLLSHLTKKVVESLNCKISNIFYYSDSTIVLAWLKTEPAFLKTFVSNRVAEIQRLTNVENWQHVKSEDNPADAISRGVLPSQLKACELWWNGPAFLHNVNFTPSANNSVPITDLPDLKKSTLITNIIVTDETLFERFSNFSLLNRTVAWCLRFKANALALKANRKLGKLDLSELNHARQVILRVIQAIHFQDDIKHLKKDEQVKATSKLSTLNPFLDDNNLLRVGGRISKANLTYDKKFPIVMPHNSHITRLLISQEHKLLLHAGAQATLASLRNTYWPLRAKGVVRQILHSCVTCFRVKPSSHNEMMGNLPNFRVSKFRPFLNSGVDYAGPFYVKEVKHRNRKLIKVYLCIFICMATKAVHLEVASDLTAATFLNVLKRFVSRRGICQNMYSDNGGCFAGADNDLKRLLSDVSQDNSINLFFDSNEITWHFIPARSPHMGGLWEAAVKSAKHHLRRVIGQNNLTLEDFGTLCVQVEAILNSRPLIPLSEDPNDLTPLTPSHFLIGDTLTAIPQMDVEAVPFNRLSAYHQLQQMSQHFWSRWHKEYLSHLQQRIKWKQQSLHHLKIGAMVLVKEDNVPPLCWPLARIVQLHPGDDGIVRVVSLNTKSGVLRRAVSRICVLPI